jgi:hypothetical protein
LRALNALIDNAAQAPAVAIALSTAINRAAGALNAGAAGARRTQLAAAVRFARQEAGLLRADIGLRGALERLLSGGLATASINRIALRAALKALDDHPLSGALVRVLRALGFSSADLQALRQQLEHGTSPRRIAIEALLVSTAFDSAEQAAATDLDALSAVLARG